MQETIGYEFKLTNFRINRMEVTDSHDYGMCLSSSRVTLCCNLEYITRINPPVCTETHV